MALPKKSKEELAAKTRRVYAELPALKYLCLEQEAVERGVTPYVLASSIVETYLDGGLVERPSDVSEGSPLAPCPSPSPSVAASQGQGD